MKRTTLAAIAFFVLSALPALAQYPYAPIKKAAYIYNGTAWTQATTSYALGSLSYGPPQLPAIALYCYNTNSLSWVPWTGACSGQIVNPTGTPTFTAGTNVTSCGCASGYTCTNQRGEITIVGGTATTGTICTVNFSSTLSTAPGYGEASQNGGTSLFAIGHGQPLTTGMTVTAGITVAASTVTVDYRLMP